MAATAVLSKAGWQGATRLAIPSDASDRRYWRLEREDGAKAILMQAPVAGSTDARQQFKAFRRIASWLRGIGLCAPEEYAADPESGHILMEDLGTLSLAQLVDAGSPDAKAAYDAALQVLLQVARADPPEDLAQPDPVEMADMTSLTLTRIDDDGSLTADIRRALLPELERLCQRRGVVSLRDVHGDNLIWRPERSGPERIGVLDFQDAVILPDGYDLASLLDDPRREIPLHWRAACIAAYAAARGRHVAELDHAVSTLSLLRNLRILGIFRRLSRDLRRTAYAAYLPRTHALVARAAAHPELAELRAPVAELLRRTAVWYEGAA